MNIKPIKTEADYRATLKEVSALVDLDPEVGSEAGDRLDVLGLMVQAYEARHYPIELPTAIEAIKFRMEQGALSVADMAPYIGAPNRVYEVLAGTRPLSIGMIRRLHAGLGIPAEVLIREPLAA